MPTLPTKPTLKDYQDYVAAMEKERGFDDGDVMMKGFRLIEEVGELFRAIQKTRKGGRVSTGSTEQFDIPGEFADVMIFFCAMANRCDVDLEQAFREKEAANAKRTWKKVS